MQEPYGDAQRTHARPITSMKLRGIQAGYAGSAVCLHRPATKGPGRCSYNTRRSCGAHPNALVSWDIMQSDSRTSMVREGKAGSRGAAEPFDHWLHKQLHDLYDSVASEPLPDDFVRLIDRKMRAGN